MWYSQSLMVLGKAFLRRWHASIMHTNTHVRTHAHMHGQKSWLTTADKTFVGLYCAEIIIKESLAPRTPHPTAYICQLWNLASLQAH